MDCHLRVSITTHGLGQWAGLRYQGLAETEAHDPFQGSNAAPRTLKPDSNMSKGAEFGHAQLHFFAHIPLVGCT